ncbi:unnamed protein product [Amoebophrya sp. A25]|nr:unnamed protein product [Amoebophrya sp. A25]|eukprot:GSA25T00013627001.1
MRRPLCPSADFYTSGHAGLSLEPVATQNGEESGVRPLRQSSNTFASRKRSLSPAEEAACIPVAGRLSDVHNNIGTEHPRSSISPRHQALLQTGENWFNGNYGEFTNGGLTSATVGDHHHGIHRDISPLLLKRDPNAVGARLSGIAPPMHVRGTTTSRSGSKHSGYAGAASRSLQERTAGGEGWGMQSVSPSRMSHARRAERRDVELNIAGAARARIFGEYDQAVLEAGDARESGRGRQEDTPVSADLSSSFAFTTTSSGNPNNVPGVYQGPTTITRSPSRLRQRVSSKIGTQSAVPQENVGEIQPAGSPSPQLARMHRLF